MTLPPRARRAARRALEPLLVAAAALPGPACRVLPHHEPPSPELLAPDSWAAARGAEASGGGEVEPDRPWWRTFDDPALAAAVDEALEANLDLRASAQRVVAAIAQARIAGSERWPSLSGGLGASRTKQIFVGLPVPGGDVLESLSTSYDASLDLGWELDLWGRIAAESEAAEREALAAAEDHRAARHSIAAQTAKAWFAWQEAGMQVALAQESVESYRSTRQLVRRRFDEGVASAFDVRLAETDLARATAGVEERRDALERALRRLELLLGRYPAGALEGGTPEEARLPGTPPPPPAGVPGELLARRPDLAAAERRLRAADDRLYAARALLFPRLSLNGSVGRTSNEPGDLVDPTFSVWSLAANLAQPVFQGGRLRAGVDLADARVHEALAGLESAQLQAFGEVETALAGERRLARLAEALGSASEEARAAQGLARDRYASGLVDLLTVLETQRRALDAQSALLEARRRRLDQRVDLHLSLGGGFGPEPAETAHP